MTEIADLGGLKEYTLALVLASARLMAAFSLIPMFSRQVLPGMIRNAVVFSLALAVMPGVHAGIAGQTFDGVALLLLVLKEVFIGLVLGYMVALAFWAVEAIGFFVDNQRGAAMASSMNPMSGSDTSPLGTLMLQAFIVYFHATGGLLALLSSLYATYGIWPVLSYAPTLDISSANAFLAMLDRLVWLTIVLSAPAVIAMFLAEFGLGLVSRFAPQLNVFFLAMPIKSAIGILVMILYIGILFGYLTTVTDEIADLPRRAAPLFE